ncbi:MAG: HD domain-containing protein [Candidatus Omnitrophica bacterium]|nr:HD domain-containing protein [Candidatus Omnitrophota bacterium]
MMVNVYLIILFFGILLGLNLARFVVVRKIKERQRDLKSPKIITPILDKIPAIKEPQYKLPPSVLEKKILYENELNLLLKFDQEISVLFKIDDIAKCVVENLINIFSVDKCALLLSDEDNKELTVKYAIGIPQDLAESTRIKKGESLSGKVMETNEFLLIRDIDTDGWFKVHNKEKYYHGAILSMPITIKGKVEGVININNKKTGDFFNEDDTRVLQSMAIQTAIAIQNAYFYQEIQEGYLQTVTALAEALDAKDPYTYRHSSNVTKFSVAIAKEMKLSDAEVENIRIGGLLHDIGKIGIRDEILTKPEKLTDDEYAQIKTHPAKGEEILKALPFLKEPAKLIRHHHEKIDGTGYPDRLPGYNIELGAKILAVSDAFDTMVSDRPYRKALGLEKAIEELHRCSGTQFDPTVAEALLNALEKNPNILKS